MGVLEKIFPGQSRVRRLYDYCREQLKLEIVEKESIAFMKSIHVVTKAEQGQLQYQRPFKKPQHPLKLLEELDAGEPFAASWRAIVNMIGIAQLETLWNTCNLYLALSNGCFLLLNFDAYQSIKLNVFKTPKPNRFLEKNRLFYAKPLRYFLHDIGSANYIRFDIFKHKFNSLDTFLDSVFGPQMKRSNFVKNQRKIFEGIMRRINGFPLMQFLDHHCGTLQDVYKRLNLGEPSNGALTQPDWIYQRMIKSENIDSGSFQTEWHKVFLLCRAVLLKIFKRDFFGSNNWKIIMKNLKELLCLKRNEGIKWTQFTRKFKPQDIKFNHYSRQQNYHLACEKHCQQLLWWMFNTLVVSIVRNCFYLTEGGSGKLLGYYFRHDVWLVITGNYVNSEFFRSKFEPVPKDEEKNVHSQFTIQTTRLIPKKSGFRLITNCSKVSPTLGKSLNQSLASMLPVMYLMGNSNPLLVGACVINYREIYDRVLSFRQKLKRSGKIGSTLYFAKVDLKNCFDSIRLDKLWTIVEQMFEKDEHFELKRYSIQNTTKRIFLQKAFPCSSKESFLDFVRSNIGHSQHRDSIYKLQGYSSRMDKESILSLLHRLVFGNYIKYPFSNEYWKQTVGIPQGSVLSTFLCAIYYGEFEQRFGLVNYSNDELVMRYVDDYLFLSTHPERVQYFLSLFEGYNQEYNFAVNSQKTETNLYNSSLQLIKWCGIDFDLRDFSLKIPAPAAIKDSIQHQGLNMNVSTLHTASKNTVDKRVPFCIYSKVQLLRAFESKYTFILRVKLSDAFIDCRICNTQTLLYNIHLAFNQTAHHFCLFFRLHGVFQPMMRPLFRNLVKFCINLYCWRRRKNPNLMKFIGLDLFLQCLVQAFVEHFANERARFSVFYLHLKQKLDYFRRLPHNI